MGTYDELIKTGKEFSLLLQRQESKAEDADPQVCSQILPVRCRFGVNIYIFYSGLEPCSVLILLNTTFIVFLTLA